MNIPLAKAGKQEAKSQITRCPCCEGSLSPPFYTVGPVPTHSCLMLKSAEEAMAFPTGTVRLAFCKDCGFVCNIDFDPRWSAYAPNYEDQQSYSSTFNSFAGKMAIDLLERYNLEGKAVVEVGCSKGDFLRLLCEAGGMNATGIDPSVLPGRIPPPKRGTLDFIADYYRAQHLALPADMICCRHTLEHIQNVHETLVAFRKHAELNPGCVLVIEVPDTMRVLKEAAFEDIYYEHCSYFTPGSLARALRRAGFAVRDLRLEYSDQYLVAEATLDPADNKHFEIEESPQEVIDAISLMRPLLERKTGAWRMLLASSGVTTAIWGSGSKCVAFQRTLGEKCGVDAIIDINPHRNGRYAPSSTMPISTPEALVELKPKRIILMNEIYRGEIEADLQRMGLSPEILTLSQVLR